MADAIIQTHSGDTIISRDATQGQIDDLLTGSGPFVKIGDVVVAVASIASACLADGAYASNQVIKVGSRFDSPLHPQSVAGHRYTEEDLEQQNP